MLGQLKSSPCSIFSISDILFSTVRSALSWTSQPVSQSEFWVLVSYHIRAKQIGRRGHYIKKISYMLQKQIVWFDYQILNTCCNARVLLPVDIHPPNPTAYQVGVASASHITLTLVHNEFFCRWRVSTEALKWILNPSKGKALLCAASDAISWAVVVVAVRQLVWIDAAGIVYDATPAPGGASTWMSTSLIIIFSLILNTQ